ncbi:MAG: DUF308 domain-containing protein [Phycisphaerales bacterium]|nr:DUF308 domain-containing protein [Phycisphaerales bacterium]
MPSAASPSAMSRRIDPAAIRNKSGAFLFFGALMVFFGIAAIGWSCLATITIAAVWIFGVLLAAGGLTEIVSAVRGGAHRLLHGLLGVLYLVVGAMIVSAPAVSAIKLTLVMAIFMIVSGVFRVVYALGHPGAQRGPLLLSGALSLMLGVMIYRQWPSSGLWVIGLFLGIELILTGWLWIALAMAARRLPAGGAAAPA